MGKSKTKKGCWGAADILKWDIEIVHGKDGLGISAGRRDRDQPQG